MNIEYDPLKNQSNILKHGLSFEDMLRFEWDSAIIVPDARKDYGEKRHVAYGLLDDYVAVLVGTWRGKNYRIISLRYANAKERKLYEKKIRQGQSH